MEKYSQDASSVSAQAYVYVISNKDWRSMYSAELLLRYTQSGGGKVCSGKVDRSLN